MIKLVLGDTVLYSSIDNKKIKELKKLHLKKYRDRDNMFLVEGEHLVFEAYNSGYLKELLVEEGNDYDIDVPVSFLSSNVIKYLSNLDTPSKVIGVCEKKENKIKGSKILILDEIQDPGNLGTIIRSAVAFNVDTIVLSKDTVDLYSPKVIRATQGMIFKVNVVIDDINVVVENLKKDDYKIIGTKVTSAKNLKCLEKMDKFAIIMGNEGNGVKKEVLDLCDEYVYIKMNNDCESLNVAVATSIILFWVGD